MAPLVLAFRAYDLEFAGETVTSEERNRTMLAAMGLGLIGTVLLIVLVIAGIMFFLRRA